MKESASAPNLIFLMTSNVVMHLSFCNHRSGRVQRIRGYKGLRSAIWRALLASEEVERVALCIRDDINAPHQKGWREGAHAIRAEMLVPGGLGTRGREGGEVTYPRNWSPCSPGKRMTTPGL